MLDDTAMGVPLDSIAHIIQLALTPVFLLSGIGSLLSVITARLGRVADQADAVAESLRTAAGVEAQRLYGRLLRLRRRLRALDAARAFGAVAGMAICAATFTLFLGALQNAAVATVLFLLFGVSVVSTMGCLLGFLTETVLSSRRTVPARQPGGNPA